MYIAYIGNGFGVKQPVEHRFLGVSGYFNY